MTGEQAAAFLVFALVAAITPGPSNTMITATGAKAGFRRGLPCALGAAAGMGSLLFASALGLGQLVIGYPAVLRAMNFAGAAFLLWLAWKIATSGASAGSDEAEPLGFLGAAAFQWMNPKGWLVAVSAAGTYLQTAADSAFAQAAAFGGLFFCAALPSGLLWLGLGAMLQSLLADQRKARLFNMAMGLALAASVVLMVV